MFRRIVDKILFLINKLYHRSYAHKFKRLGNNITLGPRVFIDYPDCVEIGDDVHTHQDVWISIAKFNYQKGSEIQTLSPSFVIGEGTYIGRSCLFACIESVCIGKSVMFSDRCFVGDAVHGHQNLELPIIDQYLQKGGSVNIGDGCWLGVGAVILPGVQLGKHCVIGANSVVTKNIPDYSVAVGNPARVIRNLASRDG